MGQSKARGPTLFVITTLAGLLLPNAPLICRPGMKKPWEKSLTSSCLSSQAKAA